MKSNSEKISVMYSEFEVLPRAKKPINKLLIKDYGFGFYYPNAVAVSRKKLELIRTEKTQSGQCS